MSFDPNTLLASLLVSSIGFALYKYGRKMQRMPQTAVGVVMLVYPYVVSSVPWMLGIGGGLLALMWAAIYLGL